MFFLGSELHCSSYVEVQPQRKHQIYHLSFFHRYMFFTDWEAQNGQPGLERAFMDGTNRYGIIGNKLGWPAGITLDIEAKRIYWVDSRYDYIETATYDGLHR